MMMIALSIIGSLVVSILAAHVHDLCPALAQRLTALSANRLHDSAAKDQYAEEWQSHLASCATRLGKLWHALGCLRASFALQPAFVTELDLLIRQIRSRMVCYAVGLIFNVGVFGYRILPVDARSEVFSERDIADLRHLKGLHLHLRALGADALMKDGGRYRMRRLEEYTVAQLDLLLSNVRQVREEGPDDWGFLRP